MTSTYLDTPSETRAREARRIDELVEPPVVGRVYLVPTILYEWAGLIAAWPVMGPKHEDADHLHFPWSHYHIDARFVTPEQARHMRTVVLPSDRFKKAGDTGVTAVFGACAANPLRRIDGQPDLPEPAWVPMRCARGRHVYPSAYSLARPHFQSLHKAYAGRRCGKNAEGLLVCPHKGFVLNSLQRDKHGRVVCPLHGLVIDMAAETVLPASLESQKEGAAVQHLPRPDGRGFSETVQPLSVDASGGC
jgi:hypothetical protein